MTELRPCPFCGSDEVKAWRDVCGTSYYVTCGICYIRTLNYSDEEQAIEVWNRRAGE